MNWKSIVLRADLIMPEPRFQWAEIAYQAADRAVGIPAPPSAPHTCRRAEHDMYAPGDVINVYPRRAARKGCPAIVPVRLTIIRVVKSDYIVRARHGGPDGEVRSRTVTASKADRVRDGDGAETEGNQRVYAKLVGEKGPALG